MDAADEVAVVRHRRAFEGIAAEVVALGVSGDNSVGTPPGAGRGHRQRVLVVLGNAYCYPAARPSSARSRQTDRHPPCVAESKQNEGVSQVMQVCINILILIEKHEKNDEVDMAISYLVRLIAHKELVNIPARRPAGFRVSCQISSTVSCKVYFLMHGALYDWHHSAGRERPRRYIQPRALRCPI